MTAATVPSALPTTEPSTNEKQKPGSSSTIRVELTPLAQLSGSDRPAWDALFDAQQGIANPFCAPEWVQNWYEFFTEPEDRFLFTVRDGDRLIAVAPFFRSSVTAGRMTIAKRLQLVGSGQGGSLLELPQILAAPGREREALRAVVTSTITADTGGHWLETSVTPSMTWFDPSWVINTGRPVAFHRHQLSRACVVIPLLGSWSDTRTALKRNVKESLRRSKNRLAKDGRAWSLRQHTDTLDASVVERFLDLHRNRAEHEQSSASTHPDAYSDPTRREFMRTVLPSLGIRGRARILELELGNEVVASQLVLHAPGLTYIHSSGFNADVWNLGPVTFLQGEAIAAAADRGERWINMSPGPHVAKLRWSERLDVHHDFAYGAGSRSLRWRYTAFASGQTRAQINHAIVMGAR